MRKLLSCGAAALALSPMLAHAATVPPPVAAVRAADFLGTLGVNTHLNYNDGAYASISQALSDLQYLGINQVRDQTPNPAGGSPYQAYIASIAAAVRAGVRFDFITGGDIPTGLAQIDAVAKQRAGAVEAVEGPNEVNNQPVTYGGITDKPGFGDHTAANNYQAALCSAVRKDANLPGMPVYYYTGQDIMSFRPNADYANEHPYPYDGQSPGARISSAFAHDYTDTGAYPKVITEIGYFNQPSNPGGSGVDSRTQEVLTLDALLDAYSQSIHKTYLYQLRSAYPDPAGNNSDTEYGLFTQANVAKPAAVGIHNLTSLLSDNATSAASFTTAPLAYSVSGLPATGKSLLIEKASGSYALALWAEPAIWNEAKHAPVAAPSVSVKITFRAPVSQALVQDPTVGTTTLHTYTNASAVTVTLTDHPILVKIFR